MFGRTDRDIVRTLSAMQDRAMVECRYNQTAAIKLMGEWMRDDRRFDEYPDKEKVAREQIDARAHGRVPNLREPTRSLWTGSRQV